MRTLTGTKLTQASRRHCRIPLALATAWMLTQALALDVEVVRGGVELVPVGKWPAYSRGPLYAVATQGDYAYVAAGNLGLIIIDIRDPA